MTVTRTTASTVSPGIDWGLNTDLETVTGSAEPSVFVCEETDFVFACGVADPVAALALIRARELFLGPQALPTEEDLPDFRQRWARAARAGEHDDFHYVEGPHVPGAFPVVVWNA